MSSATASGVGPLAAPDPTPHPTPAAAKLLVLARGTIIVVFASYARSISKYRCVRAVVLDLKCLENHTPIKYYGRRQGSSTPSTTQTSFPAVAVSPTTGPPPRNGPATTREPPHIVPTLDTHDADICGVSGLPDCRPTSPPRSRQLPHIMPTLDKPGFATLKMPISA
ncbi:hypothetical protein H0H81_007256 [Sphagnurus paluster]|uniref:Uncharacterized protein n=1 Tax=Sphagnurus paluster TaxID=117069 RepID=A0A9P7FX21_9AGAR|nr:hypothetical protein H0H81_007256 [Sphagnurus paluster]